MNKKLRYLLIFCIVLVFSSQAQDSLPNFLVRDLGKGRAQISWNNPYNNLVQLTVQRSFDSVGYFKTIFSSQSPTLPQNGFVDNNLPIGYKVFYRLQYVFQGGAYVITASKSPGKVSTTVVRATDTDETQPSINTADNKIIKIYKPEKPQLIAEILAKNYLRFQDSVTHKTKDTLVAVGVDEVEIHPFIPKPVWKPSNYVFTANKGYIYIHLPLAKQHKYSLLFFDEHNSQVLHIKQVKETELVLDKSNFHHMGWYSFELYQNDKLVEKNKIYVGLDR